MRSITFASMVITMGTLVGCGDARGTFEDEDAIVEGEAEMPLLEGNALHPNAIQPNAIHPNAIHPNAIHPNALTPLTLSPSMLAAIQDPGDVGRLSRMFLQYAVSCAFDASQSFSFSWTDSKNKIQLETYTGAVGLAPSWATGPLDLTGQRWVSACLAARTNWYGVTVTLSLRGGHEAIKQAGLNEKFVYPREEGAFWGNLFASTPYLHACEYVPNAEYSRSLQRDCAAGHVGTNGIENCGIIARRGSCNVLCDSLDPNNAFRPKCAYDTTVSPSLKTAEVVTVFLP